MFQSGAVLFMTSPLFRKISVEQTKQSSAAQIIHSLVKRLRRTKLSILSIEVLLLSSILFQLLNIFTIDLILILSLLFIFIPVSLYIFIYSTKYRTINANNLLQHINIHSKTYQESAQLILCNDEQSIGSLKELQKNKVEKLLLSDFKNGKLFQIIPTINFKRAALLTVLSVLFFVTGEHFKRFLLQLNDDSISVENTLRTDLVKEPNAPAIVDSNILITPPGYTKIKPSTSDNMNIEIPEGSHLSWSLKFSQLTNNYYFLHSRKLPKLLTKSNELFLVDTIVDQTSLYTFSYKNQQTEAQLDGIYTLSIVRDTPPKVKITLPNSSLTEIKKNQPPEFTLQVHISDDYQITDISILASVAKGSGEAVKFRDKTFRFSNTNYSKDAIYSKQWSLTDLAMEPGDEVYFRIVATDNKHPVKQSTRSSSIIVRWLDETETERAAEGLRIAFVPEYFRSQRQIIIETEQLIADKRDLTADEFQDTSIDLGHSQSDLKEKYGQYLGDEFGEALNQQFGLADGYHGGESHSSGEATAGLDSEQEHHKEEKFHQSEHAHQESETVVENDHSGAQKLIKRFTHSHGNTEIGPISSRDPKSWMKMAVNEMWQAELHLMLSEPEKALPFEYKAYDYLKRARQADRIYAKRLGFEPPPVSEDRRLTGELLDILEYDLSYTDQKNSRADTSLFKRAYQLMHQSKLHAALEKSQADIFNLLSTRLLEMSESRSVLVKYAAIAEKIALTKSISISQCDGCISQLKNKLWQLLPNPTSLPNTESKRHNLPVETENRYLDSLKELRVQ